MLHLADDDSEIECMCRIMHLRNDDFLQLVADGEKCFKTFFLA